MTDFPILEVLGFTGLGVLVAGWLVVSFSDAPRTRERVASIAATAMYLALGSLFANLVRAAWREDGTVALIAFGFLLLLFSAGFVVSVVKTTALFRGASGSTGSRGRGGSGSRSGG